MNAQEIAKKNKILEFRIGSHLYGTNILTSDEDFGGIFVPDEEQIFGFEKIEQVDLSIKSKREDGKNDQNAVDVVIYELRKFVRLALNNNPNVLEMLFINKENITFQTEYGEFLLKNAELFPHVGLKQKFLGYARSQKHKMIIRVGSFHSLQNASAWLEDYINDGDQGKSLLVEIMDKQPFFVSKGNNIQCGDLNFQKHFMLKKVKKMIDERLSKATNRKELFIKYGYDVKFASHLIRLMLEGVELLATGKLKFPLSYADKILDIKNGGWKMGDVLEYAEYLESDIEKAVIRSHLPKNPRYDDAQKLTIDLIKYYHGYDWVDMVSGL